MSPANTHQWRFFGTLDDICYMFRSPTLKDMPLWGGSSQELCVSSPYVFVSVGALSPSAGKALTAAYANIAFANGISALVSGAFEISDAGAAALKVLSHPLAQKLGWKSMMLKLSKMAAWRAATRVLKDKVRVEVRCSDTTRVRPMFKINTQGTAPFTLSMLADVLQGGALVPNPDDVQQQSGRRRRFMGLSNQSNGGRAVRLKSLRGKRSDPAARSS